MAYRHEADGFYRRRHTGFPAGEYSLAVRRAPRVVVGDVSYYPTLGEVRELARWYVDWDDDLVAIFPKLSPSRAAFVAEHGPQDGGQWLRRTIEDGARDYLAAMRVPA